MRYGRQLGNFYTEEEVKGVGKIPMAFIRAPFVESAGPDAEIIAEVEGNIVGVKYGNQIGISFHPEVTDCTKVHEYFLQICKEHKQSIGA